MIKVLVVADDITGALDTGVQFAKAGASTTVMTCSTLTRTDLELETDVLVINSQTRHLRPEEAYRVVFDIVSVVSSYPEIYLYKKTDSVLRGNIGSELTAMLDASGNQTMAFLPAFPKQGRTTKNTIQYFYGEPIHETVFSTDPFEPVVCSNIADIIRMQSAVKTVGVTMEEMETMQIDVTGEKKIYIFDSVVESEMRNVARWLKRNNALHTVAGCAGFASALPEVLSLGGNAKRRCYFPKRKIVICGSINPISQKQIEHAQKNGFFRITLPSEQIVGSGGLKPDLIREIIHHCGNNTLTIIDTGDCCEKDEKIVYAKHNGMSKETMRKNIAKQLGRLTKVLAEQPDSMLVIIGGDTLEGFLQQFGCKKLYPVGELTPGAVISFLDIDGKEVPIVSKSGGFGEYDWLISLEQIIGEGTPC